MLIMVLANRSISRPKIKELSKSPKNLKGLKSCKSYWFEGTFIKTPIFCQRTRVFVRALTVFRALFIKPKKFSQGHFRFNYWQGIANKAANALSRSSLKESDVKGHLEVSQLITNDYYLERKRMLNVNGWSSAIDHVTQSREQSCGTLKRCSIDLSQSSGL